MAIVLDWNSSKQAKNSFKIAKMHYFRTTTTKKSGDLHATIHLEC